MKRSRATQIKQLRALTEALGSEISDDTDTEKRILATVQFILDNTNVVAEIIDKEGKLLYSSPALRAIVKTETDKEPKLGGQCYTENHGFDNPCKNCVAFKAAKMGEPVRENVDFDVIGPFKMTAIPLFDNGVSAILLIAEKV